MERRGQARRAVKQMNLPAAVDEAHRPLPADQVRDAQAAVEVEQVGATAEQDMLAVVELLTRLRLLERSGAAAQGSTGFEQRDRDARGFERDRGSHPRETAPHHDDARWIG